MASGELDPEFRFFLLDEGPFNIDSTVRCLMDDLGATLDTDDIELRLLPNYAEHLVDLWLLKQLRAHPRRTTDRSQARLFVLGTPLTVSYVAAAATFGRCGAKEDHERRAAAVKDALAAMPEFQRCDGCDFLLAISSPFWRRIMGAQLHKYLMKGKRIIFATADKEYHKTDTGKTFGILPASWSIVVIPYKAHFMLEQSDLARQPGGEAPGGRDVSVTFHGTAIRRNEGRGRPQLLRIAARVPGSSVRDADFKTFGSVAAFAEVSRATASTYLRSSFCLVPAGDTPTSRRLFDALAAGCVPIVLADFGQIAENLPFVGAVDWANIAVFAGPLDCVGSDEARAESWLRGFATMAPAAVESMRERGRAEFARALAYGTNAVADQLLFEASLKIID